MSRIVSAGAMSLVLGDMSAALAQQGLTRSQSEAVTSATEQQMRQNARPRSAAPQSQQRYSYSYSYARPAYPPARSWWEPAGR